jgi:cell division protein FtsL
MQSAAYDLSRFEARPRQKQQAKTQPQLKVVKGKAKKKAVSLKLSPVVAVLVAVVAVAISAYMLYTKALITETSAAITRTNKEITTLQSEQVRLDSELDAIMSRGNIEEKALSLGMYQADKLQVQCIEVNKGDKIEVLEDERNIFQKIGNYLGDLF